VFAGIGIGRFSWICSVFVTVCDCVELNERVTCHSLVVSAASGTFTVVEYFHITLSVSVTDQVKVVNRVSVFWNV
jgi:hypothetical protein